MTDRVVAITGATGTLGKAVREKFISKPGDWAVYGCARNVPGDDGFLTSVDVRHPEAVAQWLERLPRVDAIVTCAGLSKVHSSLTIEPADWWKIMDVNVGGTFFAVREAIKLGATRVVTIGSIHGCTPTSYPKRAVYTASKAAVKGLTEALAVEFAPKGVAISCIAPGHLPSLMLGTGLSGAQAKLGQQLLDAAAAKTPLGRLAKPEEVAEVIYWLCDAAPVSMTGVTITIDGAFTLNTFPLDN